MPGLLPHLGRRDVGCPQSLYYYQLRRRPRSGLGKKGLSAEEGGPAMRHRGRSRWEQASSGGRSDGRRRPKIANRDCRCPRAIQESSLAIVSQ